MTDPEQTQPADVAAAATEVSGVGAAINKLTRTMLGSAATASLPPENLSRAERCDPQVQMTAMVQQYPELHPYIPATIVPTYLLKKLYTNVPRTTVDGMYCDAEIILSEGPDDCYPKLMRLAARLGAYLERNTGRRGYMMPVQGRNYPGDKRSNQAALLLASLPAFADQLTRGSVSNEATGLIYHSLMRHAVPYARSAGDLSESLFALLMAHAGPEHVVFPSGVREERMLSIDGVRFNHDFQKLLPGGQKVPIEVKASSLRRVQSYDQRIITIAMFDLLGPIFDADIREQGYKITKPMKC